MHAPLTGAASARAGAPRPAALAGAALVAALVAVMYGGTFATLWTTWATNDNYSHGPLVPLVAVALVWMRRHKLAAIPVTPDARGLAVVAVACAMQLLGIRADVLALQGYSLPLLLLGLSLVFGGGALTRALAFPILYLVFMLTFPPIVVNRLGFALKEVAMDLSTRLATLAGARFEQDGMALRFASGELRIEHPCSGLRSLLALLATGALFGWAHPGAAWRRVVVFMASMPIAIVANALRLTLLIVVADRAGVPVAGGWVHDVSGYLLYAVALAGLLAVRALLLPRAAASGAPR